MIFCGWRFLERRFHCPGFSDELSQNAVFKESGDADTADLVAEVGSVAVDFDVVHGVAGKIAVFGLLEENVVLGAELLCEEGLMELGGDFTGEGCAALLFGFFDLIRHGCGRRSLAAGVGEDVDGGKAAGLHERKRIGELLLGFAGEADDEVGGDGAVGEEFVKQTDAL